ncbi:FAD-dependent oxidoreductase [Spirosoma sp. RP8]|uniref:FAD-dependent oxidoreductase n=1 Tax=Spirosoma liriopis TaxID=2937440 RepID=A0ABT0HT76_9BACT|nr:FAD-dependent oxidoreductase [Spirosoma liriopis]MCK8494843.1 FAD-dependent oxidoreductase [Spirosoma liriopis]
MKKTGLYLLCLLLLTLSGNVQAQNQSYDICIYGGTSAGVIAAYTAKKTGKTVLLIEPGRHLGGMSSGGLGYTDIGNKYAITGLANDFYRRMGQHYGKFEQWIFEPSVAENLFKDYCKRGDVPVIYEHRLVDVEKKGITIQQITLESSTKPTKSTNRTIRAKMFIDCSYEGDLMAKAGVSYTVGREANSQYNETFNGVQVMEGHQMPEGTDPYVTPGDSKSGLLWGIHPTSPQPAGSGDKKIQAYNFRICLTNKPENRVPITKPDDYDPKKYELLLRIIEKRGWKSINNVFIWSLMPNGKTDINNRNGFSTDMIGMNWDYPDADYTTRAKIWNDHVSYSKGLLYFVGNDPRIPTAMRDEMQKWGYPKDEYTDNGNWTHQLYVREARRLVGELVMTQNHCQGRETVTDGVGMAAYTMDSHNCDRQIIDGFVKNEGNVEKGGFGPYPVSYRAIIPKQKEVSNLLVPVCLSATHIAYGSIRMEPVFMVLGQSAAVAAGMAIDAKQSVQTIDVKKLQQRLASNPLADGSAPDILITSDNAAQTTTQGSWVKRTSGGYGPSFFVDTTGHQEAKSIRFKPTIPKAGKYAIYTYVPKVPKAASQSTIDVFDGQRKMEKTISSADVKVAGQTSGEWVHLGDYQLPAGNNAYVEITSKGATGAVVADDVLFVPEKRL